MRGHEAGRRPQVGRVLVQANTLGLGRCRFCAGDRHTPSQVHMVQSRGSGEASVC